MSDTAPPPGAAPRIEQIAFPGSVAACESLDGLSAVVDVRLFDPEGRGSLVADILSSITSLLRPSRLFDLARRKKGGMDNMNRTGLMRFAWTFALLTLLAAATVPEASAQLWRRVDLTTVDGEPTDPDGALAILDEAELDLESLGLATSEPTDEMDAESWWEAILRVLVDLGLVEVVEGDGD